MLRYMQACSTDGQMKPHASWPLPDLRTWDGASLRHCIHRDLHLSGQNFTHATASLPASALEEHGTASMNIAGPGLSGHSPGRHAES